MSIFGMQAGYIETGAKKMTTRIISTNGRYRYKVDLEWKSMPKVRSYDILGMCIENNVSIYSNVYFQQNYCYSSGSVVVVLLVVKRVLQLEVLHLLKYHLVHH